MKSTIEKSWFRGKVSEGLCRDKKIKEVVEPRSSSRKGVYSISLSTVNIMLWYDRKDSKGAVH